ncbi:MAG: GWxTD domain-containing protein [Candidatus Cloacimonetes bacterium]|nr:GWxTD domain-containing protein [Candidatus Cloacimonadota bacterium]
MMRFGFALFFLISSFVLTGFEITHYDTRDQTWFYIYIPYKEIVKQQTDEAYQAESKFHVFVADNSGRIINTAVFTVQFKNLVPQFGLDDYYPIIFNTELAIGEYSLICSWSNKFELNQPSRTYLFSIDKYKRRITPLLGIAHFGGLRVVPRQLKGYSQADSVTFVQGYSVVPDSVVLHLGSKRQTLKSEKPEIQITVLQLETPFVTIYSKGDFWRKNLILFSPAFAFQSRYNSKEQLRQLVHIIDKDTYRQLKQIPSVELQEAINRWWKSIDPTPQTPLNENRQHLYKRVLYADEHFSVKGLVKGWRSDRGRIFIKYGQPDNIDVEPSRSGKYHAIFWSYYQLEKTFIFYDKGYGKYELHKKWLD